MSRHRFISPRLVALSGVALLACAGCRSRQPAVILSPKYQIPNPYLTPKTHVVHQPATTVRHVPYVAQRPPVVPQETVKRTPIQSTDLVREPIQRIEPPIIVEVPEVPVIKLEPIDIVPVARPVAPVVRAAPKRGEDWIVKKGDSLWAISRRYRIAVKDLAAANGITTKSLLKIGQKLRIPKDGWKAPAPTPALVRASTKPTPTITPAAIVHTSKATGPTATGGTYVVTKGDSLWRIARAHGVSVQDLKAWNQLKSDLLQLGQKLVVSGVEHQGASGARVSDRSQEVKVSDALEAAPPLKRDLHAISTSATSPISTSPAPASPKPNARVLPHYVAPGDSLRSIAMLYDADEGAIKAKNTQVSDFGRLVPGTRIEVPLSRVGY